MDVLRQGDPSVLGSYRVLGRLGEGGLGVVYLAQDSSGDRFAIKVLRPQLADDPRFRNRLAREAARIMSVAGRRTARVHEVVNEGPFVYVVMDYVEGESLDAMSVSGRRIQGPLFWFTAMGLVEALEEIHGAGLVHRDLKPSNVIIGPDGVTVTDFGFGGILDEGGLARTGPLMGSIAWLSPEQITGAAVDARSDVFNLGLVLGTMALGRHPYGQGRPEAVMYRISHESADLGDIAPAMRSVIERCLSRDPAARPDVAELRRLVASAGSGLVDDVTPPSGVALVNPVSVPEPGNVSLGSSTLRMDAIEPALDWEDSRQRQRRGWLLAIPVAALVLVAAGGVLDATNIVDLGLIGSADVATTTTTTTSTTTTTTVAPTTTAPPVTVPPPPVHQISIVEGSKVRWNPCQNPIRILLNPAGALSATQQSNLEAFLTDQASVLSQLTGMTIEYGGLSDKVPAAGYTYGETILIHIGAPGTGILQDDKVFEGAISTDRIKGEFREIDAVQLQYNANSLDFLFTDDELRPYGQWLVMHMLGNALGLDPLSKDDMIAAGSTVSDGWPKEIMFWGGAHTEPPVWGPGDTAGLQEVGKDAGCF